MRRIFVIEPGQQPRAVEDPGHATLRPEFVKRLLGPDCEKLAVHEAMFEGQQGMAFHDPKGTSERQVVIVIAPDAPAAASAAESLASTDA